MICFKGSSQAEGQPAVTATQLEQGRTTPGDELEISFSDKDYDAVVGDDLEISFSDKNEYGVVGDGVDGLRSYSQILDIKDDDDVVVVGDGVDGLGEERGYLGEDRQGDRSEVEGLLWWEGIAWNLSYVIWP